MTDSCAIQPAGPVVLVRRITPQGLHATLAMADAQWLVAQIRSDLTVPENSSALEPLLAGERRLFADDQLAEAIAAAFSLMRENEQPLFLDLPEVQVRAPTPLDAVTAMTEHIWDDIDEEIDGSDEIEERSDDFDNHPLSEIRERMVDACPEYSGEEPDLAFA